MAFFEATVLLNNGNVPPQDARSLREMGEDQRRSTAAETLMPDRGKNPDAHEGLGNHR